jgi:hypothetical protein
MVKMRTAKRGKSKPKKTKTKKKSTKSSRLANSNSGVQPSMTNSGKVKTNPVQAKTIHEKVCAITDPFCQHARGARYPDGAGANTLAFQIRGHLAVNLITTSGQAVVYLLGSLPYNYIAGASFSTTYTLAAAYSQLPSTIAWAAYLSQYRITTAGVIIRNVLPALTAQGYMIISKQPTVPPVSSSINPGDVYGAEVETHTLYAGQEVSVMFKPTGSTSRAFSGGNSTTTYNTGWDCIKIEVLDAPLTSGLTVLDIEFFYNVEFSLNLANEGLNQFISNPNNKAAPHAIQAASDTISSIGSIVKGGAEEAGAKVLDKVKSSVEDFLTGGFELLFG